MDKYKILYIQKVEYNSEDAILVVANKVVPMNISFMSRLFGKQYYEYKLTRNEETFYFVYPFDEFLFDSLMAYVKNKAENEFWSVDLKYFIDEDMIYDGCTIHAKIDEDLCDYNKCIETNKDKKEEAQSRVETDVLDWAEGHPARPNNIPITKENQRTDYRVYYRCPDYASKMYFYSQDDDIGNNPFASKAALCKQDCLFPTCPFYDFWSVNNRFNPNCGHTYDYDEWVVKGYKERFKK